MNFVDLLVHIANVSYIIGSSFKKILYLRVFFVIGCAFEIIYFILISPKDLWAGIMWAFLIMLVNVVMIGIFIYEKGTFRLNEDEKYLFRTVFSKMETVNFRRLLNAGNWVNITNGDILIYENQSADFLMLLFQGNAEILVGDKQVAILHPGSFIGEMSFLTGETTTATVRATTNVKLYAWKKIELIKLLSKNEELDKDMRNIFSSDLISKLKTKNSQES